MIRVIAAIAVLALTTLSSPKIGFLSPNTSPKPAIQRG